MPRPDPSSDPRVPADDGPQVSGEIVREQTVRAPMPPGWGVPPPAPAPVRSPEADTVKTAPPAPPVAAAVPPPVAAESLDRAAPVARRRRSSGPDRLADLRRDDPPPVSGEVRVVDVTPEVPSRRDRPTVPLGRVPQIRRDDPPPVSGEVKVVPEPGAVEAPMPHAISDAIPIAFAASGPQPILPGVGAYGRPSTDPGMHVYSGREITGPQPRAQAEATGPHPVYPGTRKAVAHQGDTVLWIVAGALVLMALALLGFVLTW